jgi:hypothetical protein
MEGLNGAVVSILLYDILFALGKPQQSTQANGE